MYVYLLDQSIEKIAISAGPIYRKNSNVKPFFSGFAVVCKHFKYISSNAKLLLLLLLVCYAQT
jgi:hypothetical protein